jgi:hypothetical protein
VSRLELRFQFATGKKRICDKSFRNTLKFAFELNACHTRASSGIERDRAASSGSQRWRRCLAVGSHAFNHRRVIHWGNMAFSIETLPFDGCSRQREIKARPSPRQLLTCINHTRDSKTISNEVMSFVPWSRRGSLPRGN